MTDKVLIDRASLVAALRERVQWLRKEWQNGGDYNYLSIKEKEVHWLADQIEQGRLGEQRMEAEGAPAAEGKEDPAERTAIGCPVLHESDPPCDGCDCHKRHDDALSHPAPAAEPET